MENKIKKRINNSCGGRGCRIYLLPKDKKLTYVINLLKISKFRYVKPINSGK